MARTLALLVAVVLALPAVAAADTAPPPGQPQIFAQSEPDRGAQAITVDADCEQPADPSESTCAARLQLIVNGTIVDDRQATFTVGGPDLTYAVDIAKQRDAAILLHSRKAGLIHETLRVLSADGSGVLSQSSRTDQAFAGWPTRIAWKCLPGRVLAASGGALTTQPGATDKLTMVSAVPNYVNFTVGAGPVTIRLNGLSYVVAPHTTARMDCVAFLGSRGPFLVPMLFIQNGQATVSGRPHRQFSAAVGTPVATFRSLNREKVAFTIANDAKTHIASMLVHQGKTLQATHVIGGGRDFPCKSGRLVRVGPHGLVR